MARLDNKALFFTTLPRTPSKRKMEELNIFGVLPNDMDTALNYPDADSISGYAKTAALYCQTTGVIGGRAGGVFAPQEIATCAEVATIIQRFVEVVIK